MIFDYWTVSPDNPVVSVLRFLCSIFLSLCFQPRKAPTCKNYSLAPALFLFLFNFFEFVFSSHARPQHPKTTLSRPRFS